MNLSQMNRVEKFISYLPSTRRPTRGDVNAALNKYIAALDTAKQPRKPGKQLTPPAPKKEFKHVSNNNSDISSAVDMLRLNAMRGGWKSYDEQHPRPEPTDLGPNLPAWQQFVKDGFARDQSSTRFYPAIGTTSRQFRPSAM